MTRAKSLTLGVVAVLLGALLMLWRAHERTRRHGWYALQELRATSDEGYLYILLQTDGRGGEPDWSDVAYRIAIDTYDPDRGERSLPAPFGADTPTGVEFLVHLGGPDASRVQVVEGYNPYPRAGRTDEGGRLESPSKPAGGRFVVLDFEANRERFARDGRRFPAHHRDRGTLRFLRPGEDAKTVLQADVAVGADGAIEIRLPWALLNVADPSSHRVLHGRMNPEGSETVATEGFRIYAYSFRTDGERHPLVDRLPAPGSPAALYQWPAWDEPKFRMEPKEGARAVAAAMKELADVAQR